MSVFSYPQSQVIDEITYKKNEKGTLRAYLHARDEVSEQTLLDITEQLREKDWQCIPASLDGKPALEVRGFGRELKLNKLLEEKQWVSGREEFHAHPEEEISFKDKLKKRSLQAAGALYAWGDVSFIAYGWKGKSPLDVAAGVFYGLPTPPLIIYGKNDQSDLQIKDAARLMADYMKKEGDKLPESCSLQAISADHKKGLIKTADDLFRRFPSEFMNICYATAGACIFGAGIKHLNANKVSAEAVTEWIKHMPGGTTRTMAEAAARKSMRTENYFNLGVGAATFASGVFGTVVKEKAHDPDQPRKTGMEGVWEWVRERPLAITGAGYMVSTLLHAVSTVVAMKGHDTKHKESVVWRASFVASALLAELMVAISSKGHGEGVTSDKSVDSSIIALAADLIVKQPDHRQEYLINYVGKFLGRADVLAIDDKIATQQLREQVEILRKNPWAICRPEEEKAKEASSPARNTLPESDLPNWQAKVSQPAAGPQPQISS